MGYDSEITFTVSMILTSCEDHFAHKMKIILVFVFVKTINEHCPQIKKSLLKP